MKGEREPYWLSWERAIQVEKIASAKALRYTHTQNKPGLWNQKDTSLLDALGQTFNFSALASAPEK